MTTYRRAIEVVLETLLQGELPLVNGSDISLAILADSVHGGSHPCETASADDVVAAEDVDILQGERVEACATVVPEVGSVHSLLKGSDLILAGIRMTISEIVVVIGRRFLAIAQVSDNFLGEEIVEDWIWVHFQVLDLLDRLLSLLGDLAEVGLGDHLVR